MAVEWCICEKRHFSELQREAEARGWTTVEQLIEAGLCGTNCQFCVPYVRRMLRTGETSFEVGEGDAAPPDSPGDASSAAPPDSPGPTSDLDPPQT